MYIILNVCNVFYTFCAVKKNNENKVNKFVSEKMHLIFEFFQVEIIRGFSVHFL